MERRPPTMPLMPIVMLLVVVVLLATAGWLAYWGYTNQHLWVMALISGLGKPQ